MTVHIVGILFLLALSALASGTETAMTASSRGRVHQLALGGHRGARTLESLLNRKEQVLSTILLANNIVNILAAALATDVLIQMVGEVGVAYATLIMTVLVVVFSEVLPKTYAVQNADRAALIIAPVLNVVVIAFTPLTYIIGWIVQRLISLLGLNPEQREGSAATEEVRGAISYFSQMGWLARSKRQMLEGVLDLDGVELDAVMTHRSEISSLDVETDLQRAIETARQSPHSRLPLWRDNEEHIVGILHVRDLLDYDGKDGKYQQLSDFARPAYFVPDSTTLLVQFRAFQSRSEHLALLVDEYGSLQGLVTVEDILEEVVGEIWDERDTQVKGISRLKQGVVEVDASLSIREVNRHCDFSMPEERATTIGGLVTFIAGRIPEVGEQCSSDGYSFEVRERRRQKLLRIAIKRVTIDGETQHR